MTAGKTTVMRLVALVAVVVLAACTPAELAQWSAWHDVDPVAADAYADALLDDLAYGVCGEWHDAAIEAGWTDEHWSTLNRIIFRESRCEPDARHRGGATGLLQIMPMWADDCGTTPDGLLDPATNLRCGRHVLDVQGWQAWSTY